MVVILGVIVKIINLFSLLTLTIKDPRFRLVNQQQYEGFLDGATGYLKSEILRKILPSLAGPDGP